MRRSSRGLSVTGLAAWDGAAPLTERFGIPDASDVRRAGRDARARRRGASGVRPWDNRGMNLLALETATEACSVALWIDGAVRERFEFAPRRHAELVLPMAEALLAEAGLARNAIDAVAVGRGPGAFTGVRLAVAVAQGLALALNRPVAPVSTLAALALEGAAAPGERVLALIDARMGEVYGGAFVIDEERLPMAHGDEFLVAPAQLRWPWRDAASAVMVGTGWGTYAEVLASRVPIPRACVGDALPHAAAVARLGARAFARGEVVDAAQAQPVYLRDKVALTLAEQGR